MSSGQRATSREQQSFLILLGQACQLGLPARLVLRMLAQKRQGASYGRRGVAVEFVIRDGSRYHVAGAVPRQGWSDGQESGRS